MKRIPLVGVLVIVTVMVWEPAIAFSQESTSAVAAGNAQTKEEAHVQTALQVQDAVVCQDVVDRTPVGSSDVFAKESTKLYCFARVVGASGETQITHNWYYKGNLKSSVKLPVRSSSWRTWSSRSMSPDLAGEWMVEILSENGTPLESIIFFVQ